MVVVFRHSQFQHWSILVLNAPHELVSPTLGTTGHDHDLGTGLVHGGVHPAGVDSVPS